MKYFFVLFNCFTKVIFLNSRCSIFLFNCITRLIQIIEIYKVQQINLRSARCYMREAYVEDHLVQYTNQINEQLRSHLLTISKLKALKKILVFIKNLLFIYLFFYLIQQQQLYNKILSNNMLFYEFFSCFRRAFVLIGKTNIVLLLLLLLLLQMT